MTPRTYTTAEVCAILGVTRTTVSAMVHGRVLKSPARGRITMKSVDELLEDGRSWHDIAKEKRADQKAPAPSGKKRKQVTGDGASASTGKVTAFPTLTATGRQKNLID